MDLMDHHRGLRSTYIPFEQWDGIGGPYTFMACLRRELERRQLPWCQSFDACSQMLFPIQHDLETLSRGRAQGKKFVVRLDGIWYPEKHGEAHHDLNKPIREIYDRYANLVIFQSEYCRRQCFEIFGERPAAQYRIIVNGADESLFFPAPHQRESSDALQLITTGNFRHPAMVEPIVRALDEIQISKPFQLRIVGPVKESLQQWLQRDYIVYLGVKTASEIADLLRGSDIFIYSHLNPPCPNSVIEAISTGMPVVGFDSGAMSELLTWSDDLLATVNSKTFQQYQEFDFRALKKVIEEAVSSFAYFKRAAMEHACDFPFTRCADEYLAAIEQISSQPDLRPQPRTMLAPDSLLRRILKKTRGR